MEVGLSRDRLVDRENGGGDETQSQDAMKSKHWRDYAQLFRSLFYADLARYMDRRTGFDIVRFDAEIAKSTSAESLEEALERKWGISSVHLIEDLITL